LSSRFANTGQVVSDKGLLSSARLPRVAATRPRDCPANLGDGQDQLTVETHCPPGLFVIAEVEVTVSADRVAGSKREEFSVARRQMIAGQKLAGEDHNFSNPGVVGHCRGCIEKLSRIRQGPARICIVAPWAFSASGYAADRPFCG
jgi:hypothetical protein